MGFWQIVFHFARSAKKQKATMRNMHLSALLPHAALGTASTPSIHNAPALASRPIFLFPAHLPTSITKLLNFLTPAPFFALRGYWRAVNRDLRQYDNNHDNDHDSGRLDSNIAYKRNTGR